jgi:hypothetical protein
MNTLNDALARLGEAIADHLGIPRSDDLSMPDRIRDALAEARRLIDDDDDEVETLEKEIERLEEQVAELIDCSDRLDRLRDELAYAAGLPAWQWRRLPPAIVELLE